MYSNQELNSLTHFFWLYRNQLGYGLVAASINALTHFKRHDAARDSFVDVCVCGAAGWSVDSLLTHIGMPPGAAVAAAAMIGYCGTRVLSGFIKSKFGIAIPPNNNKE